VKEEVLRPSRRGKSQNQNAESATYCGRDRAGRAFKRAGTNLRSGEGDTDWHELEEHRFVHRVAAAMEQLVRERKAGPG